MALSEVARQRRVQILAVSDAKKYDKSHIESQSGLITSPEEFADNFVDLRTTESSEIINDVRVVVQKMSKKEVKEHLEELIVHGKEARNYNRGVDREDRIKTRIRNKEIPSNYYSVKVIYNK